jgi:hypothetical protein
MKYGPWALSVAGACCLRVALPAMVVRLVLVVLVLLALPALAADPDVYPRELRRDWHHQVGQNIFFYQDSWPHHRTYERRYSGETSETLKDLPLDVQSVVLLEVSEAAIRELSRREIAELEILRFRSAASVRLLGEYLSGDDAGNLRVLRIPVPNVADDGVPEDEREAGVRALRQGLFTAVAASGVESIVLRQGSGLPARQVHLTSADIRPLIESSVLKHVRVDVYVERDGRSNVIAQLARIPSLATLAMPRGHTDTDSLSALAEHAEHLTTLTVRVDPADGDFEATEWATALASITDLERLDVWGPSVVSSALPPTLDLSPLRQLARLRHFEMYGIDALDVGSFEALGALPSLRILRVWYSLEAARHDAEELSLRLAALSKSKLEVLWLENVSHREVDVSLEALAKVKTLVEVYLDFGVTVDGFDGFEGHESLELVWFCNIGVPLDPDGKVSQFLPTLVTLPKLRVVPIEFYGDQLSKALPLLQTSKSLEELHVYGNERRNEPPRVTSAELEKLSELKNLRVLRLRNCQNLVPEDLKHLSAVPRLEVLCLSLNEDLVTLESVPHLRNIKTLRRLRLGRHSEYSDEVLKAVASIPQLRELTLGPTDERSQAEIRELVRNANPHCKVLFE